MWRYHDLCFDQKVYTSSMSTSHHLTTQAFQKLDISTAKYEKNIFIFNVSCISHLMFCYFFVLYVNIPVKHPDFSSK